MALAIPRLYQLIFRSHGLWITSVTKQKALVCGHCERQQAGRSFHNSPLCLKNGQDSVDGGKRRSQLRPRANRKDKQPYQFTLSDLPPKELARYEAFTQEEQRIYRDECQYVHDTLTSPKVESELQSIVAEAVSETERDMPLRQIERKRVKNGFWNMGEVDREASGEDEQFQGDDMNELGHAELEQHREMREYARIAAWEMPLLSKLATPFQPPDMSRPLRFRYTTYMGEMHPAAQKIVLEFSPADLPDLTEAQRTKLIKLVGPRYNPETDVVKMSCEMFETSAQNKRYLGDLVDTLMAEAKDAADMFDDVPLDFRHHKFKKRVEFPEEWKMTPARIRGLEEERKKAKNLELQRAFNHQIVDGGETIREALAAIPAQSESRVLVDQPRGGRRGPPRQMLR